MKLISKLKVAALVLAGMPFSGAAAHADGLSEQCAAYFSGKRISFIVPKKAGGGFDTYARVCAPFLEASSGAPVSVSNMPGAGGLAASLELQRNTSRSSEVVMLIENIADLVGASLQNPDKNILDNYIPLGIVANQPNVIIGVEGYDLLDGKDSPVVAGAMSVSNGVTDVGMAMSALGLEMNLITGYRGSSEGLAALLRGEIDLRGSSVPTALKHLKSGGVEILLSQTDAPLADYPDIPHIAGEGGLVDQATKDADPADREERMKLAQAIADTSKDVRAFFVSSKLDEADVACLVEASNDALLDPAYAEAAQAQKRVVSAEGHEDAKARMQSILEGQLALAPILRTLIAEQER